MTGKRKSIVHRVSAILGAALALSFAGGCFVLYSVERSNTEYIYQLTRELMDSSISRMENEMGEIKTLIYDIVVSDTVQKAGSSLLAYDEGRDETGLGRALRINQIADGIQREIAANHSVVCANFVDGAGNVSVIASTRYFRLTEENAKAVSGAAVNAKGETFFMEESTFAGEKNILLAVKQISEKENLSLKHIGTVVLFIDIDRLGRLLTDVHDGIFLMYGNEGGLKFVLNDKENLLEDYDPDGVQSEAYSIRDIGGKRYFVVSMHNSGQQFSYVLFTPYAELFFDVKQVFTLYMGIFVCCCAAVLSISFFFTRRVTDDIRRFIQHIHQISWENFTQLPVYEKEEIRDRDVYALQQAFNKMSVRINELVRENYLKQILIKETQIQALQAQMNPHFLYNTLNSVYWMVKTAGNMPAADMVNSLGLLLREAISNKELVITIDKELDIVCYYLTIQKHRYEERLDIRFDVSEECSGLLIPKFTIQPLLENAIAYGVECMLGVCRVEVSLCVRGEECICQVSNDGPPPEENLMEKLRSGQLKPKGNGVGLLNIDRRIKEVFGDRCGISVLRDSAGRTVVQARMKCISQEEYEEGRRNEKQLQDYGGG